MTKNTKKIPKRIQALLMVFCLLAAALGSGLSSVWAKGTEKTTYAAFGDSIAAGYGLAGYSDGQKRAPDGSYQALLGNFLKTDACNYAVTGDDSDDCIKLLNSGKADADLKNADVISLSIGSNDLLQPFLQIAMEYFDIDPASIDASMFADGFPISEIDAASLIKYLPKLDAFIAVVNDHEELHAKAAAFGKKLDTIISILHKKAPSAEIYVTNVYNPFSSIPKIGTAADIYINEINQAFAADSADYVLVDVHTPFAQKNLTNVHFDISQPSSINPDPHPSAEGHKVIAEQFISALKKKHAPKAASLRSAASSAKYKLTAKISMPADADGYQVLYSASKNGKYQTLASASAKTFRSNSKKLKSKSTCYIKVRSYKKIKGVTYYGKTSGAKKVKIK